MTNKMQDMSWKEFDERKKDAFVILPLGSTEQHGYHLPLGTDVIISSGLAEMTAERVNGIVAPALPFGRRSAPNTCPDFHGNMGLNGMTYIHLISDLLEELICAGVKKIFILNGHWENIAFCEEAAALLSKKYADVVFLIASWWDQISEYAVKNVFCEVPLRGWEFEHAAIAETSMTMFFHPELVHMESAIDEGLTEIPPYTAYPASICETTQSGVLATPKSSTAEKGRILTESIVDGFVSMIQKYGG